MRSPTSRPGGIALRRAITWGACLGVFALAGQGCGSNADGPKGSDAGHADSGSSSGGAMFGGDDGGSSREGGGCISVSKKAEKIPLDMVIGLDTSFSMDFDDKWTNVKAALESFVTNPSYADLGIGLQFFPIRKQCSVPDYEALAVTLGPEAQVSSPIMQALDSQMMAGGTPTVPLLQGLVAYLQAHPNAAHKPVIVLATDGVPDDACISPVDGETPNTLDNATAVAAAAYAATPSISTFVIGVGSELTALDAIAQAGGTGQATLVDTGGNAQQQFLAALDAARQTAIPCDFAIPAGSGVDPAATNVVYAPVGAPEQQFVFVSDAAGCAQAPTDGWYFDNIVTPTEVILCDAACNMVKADDRGQVNVVFGCPRVDVR
jgi:Mg-chelatase subunit ChlD